MGLKKKFEKAIHDYVNNSVLPNAYDACRFFIERKHKPTYEEYLDVVLSYMKGKEKE